MLFLYQVGDLPVYDSLRGGARRGLELKINTDWRNPTQDFSGVSGQHSYSPLTRGILDKSSLDVKGDIFPTDLLDAEEFQNMLFSMGGRQNTPVIAFRYVEDFNGRSQQLDWLVNFGVLEAVPRSHAYFSVDNQFAALTHGVEIKMSLGVKWRRLSPWLWEYRSFRDRVINPNSPDNVPLSPTNKFVHPEDFPQFRKGHYFFLWETDLTDFSPEFWSIKYEEEPNDGGYGSDFTSLGDFEFFSDPLRWSADPASVYAFTDLATSGTITISVQRSTGFFAGQSVVEESVLDLAVVDTDLSTAGLSGLLADDIIFTGLVAPQPGFVWRDGAKIDLARPKWSYPSTYPGATSRGFNSLSISADGVNPRVAFLHEFGLAG